MTPPKTPRLTELEADYEQASEGSSELNNTIPARCRGKVEGYRIAQADYQPLVDAARNVMSHNLDTPWSVKQTALRDALAGLEKGA